MSTKTEATIEDLYRVLGNGKAEIVNGELVLMMPTGYEPGYASSEIFVSLREYARRTKTGLRSPTTSASSSTCRTANPSLLMQPSTQVSQQA